MNRETKTGTFQIGLFVFFLVLQALFACSGFHSATDYGTVFEETWTLVNEQYYDANFEGKDWKQIKEKYKLQIKDVRSDDAFFRCLNKMLFELGSSHCAIGPISEVQQAGSPYMFLEGSPGIDIRITHEGVLITNIASGSPADLAGLKTGVVIQTIDEVPLEEIMQQSWIRPPFNERAKRFFQTEEILRHIYGKPRTMITMGVINHEGQAVSFTVAREERTTATRIDDHLEVFLDIEKHTINGSIGYLSFSAFQPEPPAKILKTLEILRTHPGLIIDLRGNNGGSVQSMQEILSFFTSEGFHAFNLVNRHGSQPFYIEPHPDPYLGEVVLLVDEMSVSAAENMAAIMQMRERALVIGNQTSGQLRWGEGSLIGDDIMLVLPVYKIQFPDGHEIEGIGVVPDITVQLEKEALMSDVDPQLEAAMNYLHTKLSEIDLR